MADETTIAASLVLDDRATVALQQIAQTLGKVSESFQKAGEEGEHSGEKAAHGWKEGLKHIAEFAIGELLAEGVKEGAEKVIDFAKESMEAFIENEKAVRQLQGTLMMLDQGGNNINTINMFAQDLNEEMEDLGVKAGQTADSVRGIFDDIMVRGGHSVDEVKDLTEAMSQAGRITRGGPEALAQGFTMMEMGIVRARNPLVQMISATGVLKGNAKAVAAQLMKMTPEKQLELGEKAIKAMADRAKDMPKSWGEQITSIKGMVEQFMEEAGGPLTAPLMIGLDNVRASLEAHAAEIKEAFGLASQAVGMAFERFFADGEVFSNSLITAAHLIEGSAHVLMEAGQMFDFYAERIEALKGALTTGESSKAGYQAEADSIFKRSRGAINEGSADAGNGQSLADAKSQFIGAEMDAGKTFGQALDDWSQVWVDHNHKIAIAQDATQATLEFSAQHFADAFANSTKEHSFATEKYVAGVISNNEAMKQILGEAGPKIFGEGAQEFIRALSGAGPEGKEAAEQIKKAWAKQFSEGAKRDIQVNVHGGVHVVQNFRDQDPDRVAIVLKQELGRQAVSRVQSGLSLPFSF